MIAALPLIVTSLLLLLIQVWQPKAAVPTGTVLARWPVPLRARVSIQRTQIYAIAAIVILGGVGGWLPGIVQLVIVALALCIVFWPRLQYTVTNEGFALGRTRLHLWSDFSDCTHQSNQIVLRNAAGKRSTTIWMSPGVAESSVASRVCREVGTSTPQAQVRAAAHSGGDLLASG